MKFHINFPAKFNFNVEARFVRPIGFLFLFIGIALLSYSVKIFFDGRDAKSWVSHEAAISSAETVETTRNNGRKSYSVKIKYVYNWEGIRYEGDQYRLHSHSSSGLEGNKIIVRDLLSAKQDGRRYPIFLDPERPENSAMLNVVNRETQAGTLLLGFVFSLLGFLASLRSSLFLPKGNRPSI